MAATAPSHAETLAVAARASRQFAQLLIEFLKGLPAAR
jgi:hypothetical protein